MKFFKRILYLYSLGLFCFAFAQDKVRILDKNTNAEVLYEDVQKWKDGTTMNDSKVDGVIYIKHNNKYYQREISESINVKWFGAKGDGKTDDTKAFKDMLAYLSKVNYNYRVFIPEGEYMISQGLQIKSLVSLPIIQGAGMRNTILNFSNSKDAYCIQLGDVNKNSLNGGLMDFQIKGNGKNNGLVILGSAPYGVAWCRFENLFFYNVNNGIADDSKVTFFSSHFSNIHIEKYFGKAMTIYGGYNTYSGIFIVQPSGQTSKENPDKNFGSKNLAIEVIGGNNSFYNVQSEDQIRIVGGYNTFDGLVIEYLMKRTNHSEVKNTAIWVAGANTTFNNVKLIGLKSKQIEYLMTIYSQNVTLMNAMYEDENKPDQKINYPYYTSESSSGVMINCISKTTYKLDNPAFLNDTKNWSFINVEGSDGKPFSRIKNSGFKLSTEDRNKLKPEEGTEIYNTTTKTKEYWDGSQWRTISTK